MSQKPLSKSKTQLVAISPESEESAKARLPVAKFRALIDHLPVLIAYIDSDRRFRFTNKTHQNWWGSPEDQIIGKTLREVTQDINYALTKAPLDQALGGQQVSFEVQAFYPGAGKRFVRCTYVPDFDEHEKVAGVFVLVTDLSTEKKAQEDLLFEERERRLIFDSVPACIWYKDRENRILRANRAAAESMGLSTEEIEGKSTYDLYPAHAAKFHADDLEVINSGEPRLGIREQITLAKGERRWLRTDKVPFRDPSGDIVGVLVLSIDITDKVKAEEQRSEMEQQLRVSQKMEALGTLAGGIAHDFNNMLAGILGYSGLAQHELPENSPISEYLKRIDISAGRARDLVQQILAFSQRSNMVELSTVSVSKIVQEVLSLVRATLPSTIEIKTSSLDPSFVTRANQGHLHQVLLNIVTNSGYAMREHGGILEIKISRVSSSQLPVSDSNHPNKRKYLKLSISDTGTGMSEEVRQHIFEPYFTTKSTGEGSGLGLSVVHGIVSSYNGFININSQINVGTVCDIYLPEYEGTAEKEITPVPSRRYITKGQGRILFVDDEELLVQLGSDVLTCLGYQVVACKSSYEAMQLFLNSPQSWDLVITDQTMPELTGDLLIKKIHEIRPNLAVVLCTGFSATVGASMALDCGAAAYLVKPYSFEQLADVTASLIAKSAV